MKVGFYDSNYETVSKMKEKGKSHVWETRSGAHIQSAYAVSFYKAFYHLFKFGLRENDDPLPR